jgi:hypothetical protein
VDLDVPGQLANEVTGAERATTAHQGIGVRRHPLHHCHDQRIPDGVISRRGIGVNDI